MEIETAFRKWLLTLPSLTSLVGDRIWKFDEEHELEGTGHVAIVLRRNGQWAGPQHSSVEFPLLVVDVHADNTRSAGGPETQHDKEERAYGVHRAIDRVMHWKDLEPRWLPDTAGLYVLGCQRGSLPGPVTEKDGIAIVRASYNVVCVHSG